VNLGDVIVDRNEIYGDGVNIAARLESLAEPGGICISRAVFDQVKNKLEVGYEFLGEQSVKNIAAPVEVYKVRLEPEAAGTVIGKRLGAGPWRRSALVAGVVLLVGVAVAVWMRPGAPPAEVGADAKLGRQCASCRRSGSNQCAAHRCDDGWAPVGGAL
jgi:adenylate cyclase